jgi:dsDNA-specific endonuclease/ATPase MutS2
MSQASDYLNQNNILSPDAAILDQFAKSAYGAQYGVDGVNKLNGAWSYDKQKFNDANSQYDVTAIYNSFRQFLEADNKRIEDYSKYSALAKDKSGRQATILTDQSTQKQATLLGSPITTGRTILGG